MNACLIQVPYMVSDERTGASRRPARYVEAGAERLVTARAGSVRRSLRSIGLETRAADRDGTGPEHAHLVRAAPNLAFGDGAIYDSVRNRWTLVVLQLDQV